MIENLKIAAIIGLRLAVLFPFWGLERLGEKAEDIGFKLSAKLPDLKPRQWDRFERAWLRVFG